MRSLASDNHCGVHPKIMEAIVSANISHAPSYGTDPLNERLNALVKEKVGSQAQSWICMNGTGANVIALRSLAGDCGAVLCSDVAHILWDEGGAPERVGNVKLIAVPSHHGKVRLEDLQNALIRRGDQHFAQIRVLSLTQPTEYGTCYTLEELEALIEWAQGQKLKVHIDGARLANAATFLHVPLEKLMGMGDVVCLGGTKNGLMGAELIILPKGDSSGMLPFLRKQCLQLPSKARFLAAQFLAYFEGDLWKTIAEHSLQKAQHLFEGLRHYVPITHPVESNAVFALLPQQWVKRLREKVFFYVWNEITFECRLMTHWDTSDSDIKAIVEGVKGLAEAGRG